MGYPGEGVPVAYVESKEGPSKERGIERSNVRVLKYIEIVIPVDKIILKGRQIHKKGCQGNRGRKIRVNVPVFFHIQPFILKRAVGRIERKDHSEESNISAVKSNHQNGEGALRIKRFIFFAFLCG
jgi:hypothetical protein